MKKNRNVFGFTLIELLIVIVLLGFLSIAGLSMFQGSQKRARDMRRKGDLGQIAKALEMYANDYGYPLAESGKIKGCGIPIGTPLTASLACEWGSKWSIDPRVNTPVVYMQKLPKDPGGGLYCYLPVSKGYKLYAKLEGDDPNILLTPESCGNPSVSYNYVLRSSNIPIPTPAP